MHLRLLPNPRLLCYTVSVKNSSVPYPINRKEVSLMKTARTLLSLFLALTLWLTCAMALAESDLNIAILLEQDDAMINNYSLLAVNPASPFADADGHPVSDVAVNEAGAKAFIDWMLSEDTLETIAQYGYEEYGEYLFYIKDNAPRSTAEIPAATAETKAVRVSTTTSVNDSGLLTDLVPLFENEYGYDVEIYSAGTGKAIANAKAGNADLLLVHSKSQEEAFIADGFSQERLTFMYNYFVLVGPKDDPAGCAKAASVKDAFQLIANGQFPFVSRGDKSGTHTKELSLWDESLGVTAEAESVKDKPWYQYSNAGMGVCLTMANEMGAYILSDKATFLTFQAAGGALK